MSHEADISWQTLRAIVRNWTNDDTELDSVTTLHGGSIATTVALTLKDARKAVLKITPHRIDRSYIDEAWQLTLLKSCGIPVPEIYQYKLGSLDEPFSYILLEFVDGKDLAQTKAACSPDQFDVVQTELAEYLLKMHSNCHTHFQRANDGEVKRFESWPECYHDLFDPIWAEVEKSGLLPVKARKTVGKVHERLSRLIANDDCPRLMHWDLWSSNLLCKQHADGSWHIAAFIDPHCKYGHVEAELAYLDLFRTVTPAFTKAYQQQRKLTPEYHQFRKPVYQLYSMLNGLCLHGQEYLKPTLAAIEKASTLV